MPGTEENRQQQEQWRQQQQLRQQPRVELERIPDNLLPPVRTFPSTQPRVAVPRLSQQEIEAFTNQPRVILNNIDDVLPPAENTIRINPENRPTGLSWEIRKRFRKDLPPVPVGGKLLRRWPRLKRNDRNEGNIFKRKKVKFNK